MNFANLKISEAKERKNFLDARFEYFVRKKIISFSDIADKHRHDKNFFKQKSPSACETFLLDQITDNLSAGQIEQLKKSDWFDFFIKHSYSIIRRAIFGWCEGQRCNSWSRWCPCRKFCKSSKKI